YSGQADGYIGARIHKFIGFEVGYLKSFPRSRQEYYAKGEPVLGWTDKNGVAAAFDSLHNSSMHMDGAFYGVVGFLPIFESTTLFLRLGAAHIDMHFKDAWIDAAHGDPAPTHLNIIKPLVN